MARAEAKDELSLPTHPPRRIAPIDRLLRPSPSLGPSLSLGLNLSPSSSPSLSSGPSLPLAVYRRST